MIIPWLIVWAVCSFPPVHPGWNGWFVSLIAAICLL